MLKQDPSLLHPGELVEALRHHLQALENALQEISRNADRQITTLRQGDEALINLDAQLSRISDFLLQADPSRPDDILSRLKDLRSILEQQALSQVAGEALTLIGEMLNWVQERSALEKRRSHSIHELLGKKQLREALPGFALGSGVVSLIVFLLYAMGGASLGEALGAVFAINVLGYLGFLVRILAD